MQLITGSSDIASSIVEAVARKTLADLERSPKNVGLDELLSILRENGCAVRAGTRHGFYVRRGDLSMVVPRHHKIVKPVFVREAMRIMKGE